MPPNLRQPPLFFDGHDGTHPFQPNQPGACTTDRLIQINAYASLVLSPWLLPKGE